MRLAAARGGYVLLQALILALLVSIVADGLLHLALARRVAQARRETTIAGRPFVEAAYSRAAVCLAELNVTDCAPPSTGCDSACGVPCDQAFGSYALTLSASSSQQVSHSMTVTLAGGSNCQIQASCNDCSPLAVTP